MERWFFFVHILTIFKSPSFIKYSPGKYNLIKLPFDQKYNHLSYSHFLKPKLRNNSELFLNKKKSSQVSSCSSRCSEAGLLESWIYLKSYLSLFLGWGAEWRSSTWKRKMRKTLGEQMFLFATKECGRPEKFFDRKYPWAGSYMLSGGIRGKKFYASICMCVNTNTHSHIHQGNLPVKPKKTRLKACI